MLPTSGSPLHIAINSQIDPQSVGGVGSVLMGLISALGRLEDGSEEYTIITRQQGSDWVQPFLGANQRIIRAPKGMEQPRVPTRMPRWLRPGSLALLRLWAKLTKLSVPTPRLRVSNGFYESLGCTVIHFPYQAFVLCALPSIYNPHDLQHLHFPQFFRPQKIAEREVIYPAGCHLAHTVIAGSHWVKQDIVRNYGTFPDKIQVIPWAPPTQAYLKPTDDEITTVKAKYELLQPFAFYPAMVWEHKNHLRLIEALAHLRDQEGLVVNLVCTGSRDGEFWPHIEALLNKFELNNQVQFLGFVPTDEMRAIYQLAQFVIVPTLFEAASGPVFEAWQDNVPVACSTVTSLPEQVGDAALLFDPYHVETIAEVLRRMSTDDALRRDLVVKGQRRLEDFSWERTAKAYRAVYRRAAHRPLTDEDLHLLSRDWMKDSNAVIRTENL